MHDLTAEPFRVSPPEAVVYLIFNYKNAARVRLKNLIFPLVIVVRPCSSQNIPVNLILLVPKWVQASLSVMSPSPRIVNLSAAIRNVICTIPPIFWPPHWQPSARYNRTTAVTPPLLVSAVAPVIYPWLNSSH